MSTLLVTGTDTNVGKTFVSCALIAALRARGRRVAVMKPVETGVRETPEDALALQAAAADPAPLDAVCPVRLRAPLAPSVAARLEGIRLDPDDLDLMLTPGGLIIRGEKREVRQAPPSGVSVTPEGLITRGGSREANDERRRDFYVAECRYGSFVRTVPLPPGLDLDRAEARIANGVLTVRFPKATSRRGARRIPILT